MLLKLDRLEDIVVESKVNAIKAEGEISIAERTTRSQTKKVLCISFIVVFLVAAIVLIIYFSIK